MAANQLDQAITATFGRSKEGREKFIPSLTPREAGSVVSVSAGIVKVSGLPGAGFEELLKFPGNIFGIAYNIDENEIGAILLGEDSLLHAGDEVERTGRVMDIPVGQSLIGRVINPLGDRQTGKTALPIIETEAQDISAYIPTNLISITDGQIYLSPKLFELGTLPAVDVGKSVSRVGGKAQLPAYRSITGNLKLAYSQFEELETFSGSNGTKSKQIEMDTLENLRRKLAGAEDIKSMVRTMKAVTASNIGQYELVASSLGEYSHTVALGITAYCREQKINSIKEKKQAERITEKSIYAVVFGSDQGLVGQFNDSLTDFVNQSLKALPGKKEIWAVGERIQLLLSDVGHSTTQLFTVPNSVTLITPLVEQILLKAEEGYENGQINEVYFFYNQPASGSGFMPVMQRLLPLDEKWRLPLSEHNRPTKTIPQVIGAGMKTWLALIHEYLFVSLFKACAESLASENASLLAAMQRAEK